jgi:hypothetical protein
MNFWGNFFNKNHKEKRHLVFDVSSGTLAGGIVSSNDKGEIALVKTHREIFPFNKPLSGKSIHVTMLHALDKVIHELSKTSGRVESADFILSSPWLSSESKNITVNFTTPTLITDELIKKIIEEEEKNFSALIDASKLDKISLLESRVTDIKINGYSVGHAYGQKAKRLDLSIFLSVSTEKVMSEIKRALYKHFHTSKINFHSTAQSLLSYLGNMQGMGNDYVFVNVHGEVTEFIHISHSHIIAWASIPIGTRTLMRKYAEKSKISNHMALSDISLIVNGVLDNANIEPKIETLDKVQEEWVNESRDVISTFISEMNVPEKFYIYADNGMHLAFSKLFSKKVISSLGFNNADDKVICFKELTETDGLLKMGIKSIANLIVK